MKAINKEILINNIFYQFSVFVITGLICYAIDIVLFSFFHKSLTISAPISTSLSFVVVVFINYLLSIVFVFRSGRYSTGKEVLFFYVFSGLTLVMNFFLIHILVDKYSYPYYISKAAVIIIFSVLSFLFKKFFIFLK
jgi:putative flippase GtrA